MMKILAILVVIGLIVAGIFIIPSTLSSTETKKVIITGVVSFKPGIGGFLGGWDIVDIDVEIEEDDLLPFFFGFGETGEIHTRIKLQGTKSYEGDFKGKAVSSIIGGRRDFEITLRNVEVGSYNCIVRVYEVKYKDAFKLMVESEDLVASHNFRLEVK